MLQKLVDFFPSMKRQYFRSLAAKLVSCVVALTVFTMADAADVSRNTKSAQGLLSNTLNSRNSIYSTTLNILPEDGRDIYLEAFKAARSQIRIHICVLDDPEILQGLKQAIVRGVRVRAIVDNGKHAALAAERSNLAEYLQGPSAQLHVSNPVFPRSFPKIILIDDSYFLLGSACLDTTTFNQYRDFVYGDRSPEVLKDLSRLFENDWLYSAPPGRAFSAYNPVSVFTSPDLLVAPINATQKLVTLFQSAKKSLDVTSELMGNPTLEAELAAAASRGVKVRLIAPELVNGGTQDIQALQLNSLRKLNAAGVAVHVTRGPESFQTPYMHARSAIVDRKSAYLGSISLSPDSATRNRGAGLILKDAGVVAKLQRRFDGDFEGKSAPVN